MNVWTMSFLGAVAGMLVLVSAAAGAGGIVSVADFGAKGDDGKDDTSAVRKAIKRCKDNPGSTLLFPKGTYHFFATERKRGYSMAMSFSGCRDLTVDGGGSTWMFRGVIGVANFKDCHNVTVKDVTIDWDRPPFSIGETVANGKMSFDVKIRPEYPVVGGEPVEAYMEYDPKTKFPLVGGLDIYSGVKSTELIKPQLLRVHLTRGAKAHIGAIMILRHKVYGPGGLGFNECSNVRVQDVTFYASAGMGVRGSRTRDMALKNVRIMNKPGSGRIMSITADATHFNSCTGTVTIDDCLFEGMGDDAVNVHGMFHRVTKLAGPAAVLSVVRNKWIVQPDPGHRLEFTDPATLLPYATGIVKSVTIDAKARTHRITFAQPLPKKLAVGHYLGNVDWAPKLRIRNCRVNANRARGFLIQTRDAIIEGNTITNNQSAAINITTDLHPWLESIGTRKIIVRNNIFRNCNNAARWHPGVISIFADLERGKGRGAAGVHRDILIEGNTIADTRGAAVYVGSADGVVVRNNRFERCGTRPRRPEGRSAVFIHNSRNVEVTGNTLIRGAGLKLPVGIRNSDEKTIRVHDNKGF